MSLIEINYNPSKKDLRRFGITAAIASTALALLLAWLKHLPVLWVGIIIGIGLAIFLISLFSSTSRLNSFLHRPLMYSL